MQGYTCSMEDGRYFNLECGQRGPYTHYTLLTGTWTDGVTTHSVEMESVLNKGYYYHLCR